MSNISWFMLVKGNYFRSTYYVPWTVLIRKKCLFYREWQSRILQVEFMCHEKPDIQTKNSGSNV